MLIAPLFGGGDVPGSLKAAHLLNAFVMASAAVPAFLLARRVLASGRWAFVVAVLSVALPWIVLASFLLTEVAAYPAFLWAVWAMARAVEARRWRADLLALVLIVVAMLARTQLIVLAAAFPVAVLLEALVVDLDAVFVGFLLAAIVGSDDGDAFFRDADVAQDERQRALADAAETDEDDASWKLDVNLVVRHDSYLVQYQGVRVSTIIRCCHRDRR